MLLHLDSNTTLVKVKFDNPADMLLGLEFKYNTC